MGSSKIKGKAVAISVPAHALYTAFADMRHFVERLPEEKKQGITATSDTIEGEVQGLRMGAAISERIPFSCIKIKEHGQTPFQFEVSLFFDAADVQKTMFHMEVDAELPFMVKMLIGNKLQEVVDKITEQLALASEGKISPEDLKMDPFNMA
ncbi:MAG: hypothetical protein E7121_06115 [Bacteroidales bacterium]|nr:hypothetical protein [Bacteroidales bacterium]MBQ6871859.1 hypothetical protein [Bacteroidales bacterium]MBQ8034706.1 hypothetical protein [Bacteroidales bacterium]